MTKTSALGALALTLAAYAAPSYATTHKEAPAMSDAAHAQACAKQAEDKKLAGAAKTSFLKKCETDTCEAQAAEKKLAGAAKTSFVKKCVSDMHGAPDAGAMCEKQADEKKLAGAARTSFVKKCTTDAAAPKA